jgi:hypothetical protein
MMTAEDVCGGALSRLGRITYCSEGQHTYLLSAFELGGSFAWYTNPGCATVPTDSLDFLITKPVRILLAKHNSRR